MSLAAALVALALGARAAVFEAPEPLPEAQAAPSAIPQLPTLPVLPALSANALPDMHAQAGALDGSPSHAELPLAASAMSQAQSSLPIQSAGAAPRSAEAQSDVDARAFDGMISQGAASAVFAADAPAPAASGWSAASVPSPVDGNEIGVKRKDGDAAKPARVYSGGLALQESFETYFATQKGPPGPQYFLWTRGHPPTAWAPVRSPLDADARDLARVIVAAGASTKTGKVELALHSYGTVVFQRMVQLRGDPEVDRALTLVAGARVFMLNATTHYEGVERRAGPEYERMAAATKQFVGWLDMMDDSAEKWRAAARLNPLLIPQVEAILAGWALQRRAAIALASAQAGAMAKKDLEEQWTGQEDVRRALLAAVERDARDPGWQEALLRRSNDMFLFDFSKDDVKYLRASGVRLELLHSAGDKLLNWEIARAVYDRLGIVSPDKQPEPGATLRDVTGRFRARIVDGDHYFPLKNPRGLAQILDR